MPNIEIFGGHIFGLLEADEAKEIARKIKDIFVDWPCAKDIIIDPIIGSNPRDLMGSYCPFIRVWDDDAKQGEKIARQLQMKGFEVEFKKIDMFLPRLAHID